MKSSRLYPKERRACKLVNPLYLVSLTNFCWFLWVKFQLDDLCRAETDNSIRKVLRNLPRDLGETYDRLLARIDVAEQREYIGRMFSWIICARRPLEVEELREAIAFTIEDDHFDPTKIPNDLGRLARACGNLIVIDDDEDSVQMAHYTAEQYLLTEQELFRFSRQQANSEVGKVCVAYLSFSDFETQLTQYKDTTTSNFAALENVVRTKSMLPPNSQAATLVKTLKRLRGNRDPSTTIQFNQYVGVSNRKGPAVSLKTKYHLLSYVAENWLHHNTGTGEALGASIWTHRYQHRFDNSVLAKRFSFDIRPWDSIPFRNKDFPFVLQIGWAILTNNIALMHTISDHISEGSIWNYLEYATKTFKEFASQNSVIRDFSRRSIETWPNSEDWESLLWHCILKASDQSFTAILHFCLLDWPIPKWEYSKVGTMEFPGSLKATFFAHLLLDAACYGNTSIVEVLTIDVLNWPTQLRNDFCALMNEAPGNALEMAFHSKSEHLMGLLASVGCNVSASFKEDLLQGPVLREAFKSTDIGRIRCSLRIFGATTSSLSDLERRLYGSIDGLTTDASALASLLEVAMNNPDDFVSISALAKVTWDPGLRSHWIWALEDASIYDHINILLAVGTKPSATDTH
jgi:hypothetical protein